MKPGTFDPDDGSFIYVPNSGAKGLEEFTYTFSNPTLWYGEYSQESPYDIEYAPSNEALVQIEVGPAVTVDLIIEGLDAEDEDTVDWQVALNDDDDNNNQRQDRNDFKQPVSGENDLTRVTVEHWLRDDAYEDDFTAYFGAAYPSVIRLWTTAQKTEEIHLFDNTTGSVGTEFKLADLPSVVYVEGYARGGTNLTVTINGAPTALFTEMVWQDAEAATSATDGVRVVVGLGLTAYRPMHGSGFYSPFRQTAVAEKDEESTELGPGIRMNGDDDNGVGGPDRDEDGWVGLENDLIEVRIDRLSGMGNFVLERSSTSIKLWESSAKGVEIDFPDDGMQSEPVGFVDDWASVFVEWVSPNHGSADLKLINVANNNDVNDTLTFHTFRSVVVVFGGHGQSPFDTDGDGSIGDLAGDAPNREGIFDVAQDLYQSGYDVHAYDEDELDDDAIESAPYLEAVSAVMNRSVAEVAILGYSQGGGATYLVAALLDSNRANIGNFAIPFTAYIDGVDQDSASPETRRPPSDYHYNIYQSLGIDFHGDSVEGAEFDDDVDVDEPGEDFFWEEGLTHSLIDDQTEIQEHLKSRFEPRVDR